MNEYTAQQVVVGKAFADTILAAFGARPAGALVIAPKVRLSKDSGFNPQPGNVPADFTGNEADFSGYTAGGYAPTFTAPLNLSNSVQGIIATIVAIAATASPFVDNTVYGYWVDDGTNVIVAERFGSGLTANFGAAGDFLALEVRLPVDLSQKTN